MLVEINVRNVEPSKRTRRCKIADRLLLTRLAPESERYAVRNDRCLPAQHADLRLNNPLGSLSQENHAIRGPEAGGLDTAQQCHFRVHWPQSIARRSFFVERQKVA